MKIAVIGAGTMGRGIAHVCAAHGHQVSLKDVDSNVLSNSMELIRRGLEKSLERGLRRNGIRRDGSGSNPADNRLGRTRREQRWSSKPSWKSSN